DARACYADRRAARQLWCTAEVVRARERELEEVENALEGLTRTALAGRDTRIAAAIADCQRTDVEGTVVPCLERHVTQALAERKASLAVAEQARKVADVELAAPGDAATAEKLIASVHG